MSGDRGVSSRDRISNVAMRGRRKLATGTRQFNNTCNYIPNNPTGRQLRETDIGTELKLLAPPMYPAPIAVLRHDGLQLLPSLKLDQ